MNNSKLDFRRRGLIATAVVLAAVAVPATANAGHDQQNVRSVELDLMLDNPKGGRFTNPLLRQLSGEGA